MNECPYGKTLQYHHRHELLTELANKSTAHIITNYPHTRQKCTEDRDYNHSRLDHQECITEQQKTK